MMRTMRMSRCLIVWCTFRLGADWQGEGEECRAVCYRMCLLRCIVYPLHAEALRALAQSS